MSHALIIRIAIENPIPGVKVAIQTGKGSKGRPTMTTVSSTETLVFDCPIELKNGAPSGPLVQKDSKGAFIYVLWGTSAGDYTSPWTRRAKVYLPTEMPEADGTISATFAGAARDGGPCCATVKPTQPWRTDA